jgi:hypothetical protein
MHFLNTALVLAMALVSAAPAAASPVPKGPRGQHVSIEQMSVYPCVARPRHRCVLLSK